MYSEYLLQSHKGFDSFHSYQFAMFIELKSNQTWVCLSVCLRLQPNIPSPLFDLSLRDGLASLSRYEVE